MKKFVVFVFLNYVEVVCIVICDVGVGYVGFYSDCMFLIEGEGMFKFFLEVNLYIGLKGELECVNEIKVEIIFEVG